MISFSRFAFLIPFLGILLVPLQDAQAAGLVPCGGPGEDACTLCHLFALLENIFNLLLTDIIPVIAVLLLVIGGFLLFFSGANPGLRQRAKSMLTSVVIGIIIVYGAWLFINMLLVFFDIATWTGFDTWWQIECGG